MSLQGLLKRMRQKAVGKLREKCPHRVTLNTWLVTLFREVLEPLGGGTLLNEVCHWGVCLEEVTPSPHFLS